MGVHLGPSLIVPRCSPGILQRAFSSEKDYRLHVMGPLPIITQGVPCDLVRLEWRYPGGDINPFTGRPAPSEWVMRWSLHEVLAKSAFALGGRDDAMRALSKELGALPVALVTVDEGQTFGVLENGRWRGIASTGDGQAHFIDIDEKGEMRTFDEDEDAGRVLDAHARELAERWQPNDPRRGPRLAKFGVVDGIMMADWFRYDDAEPLYSIDEHGKIRWEQGAQENFEVSLHQAAPTTAKKSATIAKKSATTAKKSATTAKKSATTAKKSATTAKKLIS